MAEQDGTEIVFRHNAVDVLFDRATNMGSLTDLWRAKGSPANKQPSQWLRLGQAQDLMDALAESEGEQSPILVEAREGVRGGTWAHWQLAIVYAHYLDASFYLAWNRWAMAHISGAPAANTTLDAMAAQLREMQATLVQLRTQQARYSRPRALPAPRPLAPEAAAILAILRASAVAVSPAHVARLLEAEGIVRGGRYVRVRLMRLATAGLAVHLGHGLYAADRQPTTDE